MYFNHVREKPERWAGDRVLSAAKALSDTKEQVKALHRGARQATTREENHEIHQKIQNLERHHHRKWQDIFRTVDQIRENRNVLIELLERRLAQLAPDRDPLPYPLDIE